MITRTRVGILIGVLYGAAISIGAVYQALLAAPLIILATVALGIAAGVIAGGLLFAMIALCPGEEEKGAAATAHPEEVRAAA